MDKYVWQHDLQNEPARLRLMSHMLDPSSRYRLQAIGVSRGWNCLEVGAGNGSLSQWLAGQVGPTGHVLATDIRPDLMEGIAAENLAVRAFDVVRDEPDGAPFDLVVVRALLHHLPERREVVSRMVRWLKPGGWLFVQEPDFYPTWTVQPPTQAKLWQAFIAWAERQRIDYYVGRKVPPWMQEEALTEITAEGYTRLYNGGSDFAQWWDYSLSEVAGKLTEQGDVPPASLAEFAVLARDPRYWSMTIAFTATTGRKPASNEKLDGPTS